MKVSAQSGPATVLKDYALASVPFLPSAVRRRIVPDENAWTRHDELEVARAGSTDIRLLVGPTNTVGQAKFWADAANELPGVGATSLGLVRQGKTAFRADAAPSFNAVRHSPTWSRRQSNEILREEGFTHLLVESAQPIMGKRYRRDLEAEFAALDDHGVKTALVWHGSDIRDPDQHRQQYAHSPFHRSLAGLTEQLSASTKANAELANSLSTTEFVSTPDLLDYRPNAIWLPTLCDHALWSGGQPNARADTPVVVHIPSRASFKGTAAIQKAMDQLADSIEYRELSGLTPSEVRSEVEKADIVIDQVGMGLYGVASVEAMAIGKPVVAEVGEAVRGQINADVPIVEASAATIAGVVHELAADPDLRACIGQAGIDYVQRVHSVQNISAILDKAFLQVS